MRESGGFGMLLPTGIGYHHKCVRISKVGPTILGRFWLFADGGFLFASDSVILDGLF